MGGGSPPKGGGLSVASEKLTVPVGWTFSDVNLIMRLNNQPGDSCGWGRGRRQMLPLHADLGSRWRRGGFSSIAGPLLRALQKVWVFMFLCQGPGGSGDPLEAPQAMRRGFESLRALPEAPRDAPRTKPKKL